jgi:fibronectin type 3 domain-containing protein
MQTAQALANYTNMLYLGPQMPIYMFAYQTYGGTTANGGDANCTCTTASCSDYDIIQTENTLAGLADQQSVYTAGAVSYYNQLVVKPDTVPPTVPANLTGIPGYTSAKLAWTASSDNIGVAGYNVYRCTAPAAGQPCTGAWIANTTLPSFNDSSLTSNTYYNYQVQAFDFANNNSPLTPTLSVLTYRTTADSATNLVATPISAQEIDLSWSPPANATGLGEYLIFGGTSAANLQQIAVRPSTQTTYRDLLLAPGTTYYYGIVAVEEGIDAAMSNMASAATLPLPNPPSSVAGTPAPTAVALTWQEILPPNGLPIGFYQIFEGVTPGNMTNIGSTTATTYTAASLSPNTTYYFEVVAVDTGHDDSAPSGQIPVTTSPLPAAPVNLAATATSTTVVLTWSENIPTNGLPIAFYNIFRGTSPTSLTQLTSRNTSPFEDTAVSPGVTYYYAVQAVDTGHDVSSMSATAQVATPAVPAAPANVVATANSSTVVTVTWSENVPPNGLPIQYYNIFRGPSPTSLSQVAARGASPFYDMGVSPGTTYYYAIEAVDTVQDVSPMSPPAQVTTP